MARGRAIDSLRSGPCPAPAGAPFRFASRLGRTNFFRRVVEWIHTSLRNSRAKAHAGASPVSPTNFPWPRRTRVVRQPLKLDIGARFSAWLPFSPCSSKRTVRLINGIALDERPDREHYPARRPTPVRRSERRAGFVNWTRPVRLRRRAPIFQVVRSGLLRLSARGCRFESDPLQHHGEVAQR